MVSMLMTLGVVLFHSTHKSQLNIPRIIMVLAFYILKLHHFSIFNPNFFNKSGEHTSISEKNFINELPQIGMTLD